MENEYKIIGAQIFDPSARSLFKQDGNARAHCRVFHCKLDNCPLLSKGQCVNQEFIGPKCPYGHVRKETGFTKRARKNYEWVKSRKAKYPECPSAPKKKLVVIGDYIYLPYAHMNNATHGSFIKKDQFDWQKIASDRPQAMFGGEIRTYREKELPLFLAHLKEVLGLGPGCNVNPVGREAIVSTLPVGSTFQYGTASTPVIWDGEYFTYKTDNNFSIFITGEVRIKPSKETIKITNESQVDESTMFVD